MLSTVDLIFEQGRLARQSSAAQSKIDRLQLELNRRRNLYLFLNVWTDVRAHEISLEGNSTFRERIKQIERLALRYAPLEGADVDHLFSEIEYAKGVIDGQISPPKAIPHKPHTTKKRKKV